MANLQSKQGYIVNATAANNVVVAPFHSGTPFVRHATWYAADGAVVPTSDRALLHAIAAKQSIERKRVIRQDARIRYRPPSALLAAFAVFDVSSRTGVKVGGLTIYAPSLSSPSRWRFPVDHQGTPASPVRPSSIPRTFTNNDTLTG